MRYGNSLLTINQKIYSTLTKELQVFGFVAVTYITASLLSLVILLFLTFKNKSNAFRKPKKVVLSGCCVGILLGVIIGTPAIVFLCI